MSDSTNDMRDTFDDELGLTVVRELLRMIRETDVTELQIERGDIKLHIKRGLPAVTPYLVTPSLAESLPGVAEARPLSPTPTAPVPASNDIHGARNVPPNSQIITAPMVGTFFSASSPKDPPFVRVGDEVRTGEVVGIVEAMKIMNEIEAEFAGRVVQIMAVNGQPVEYGQPLMAIEPL